MLCFSITFARASPSAVSTAPKGVAGICNDNGLGLGGDGLFQVLRLQAETMFFIERHPNRHAAQSQGLAHIAGIGRVGMITSSPGFRIVISAMKIPSTPPMVTMTLSMS